MDLVDLIQTRRFLGAEFMLWLWFKCECFDNLLHLPEHGNIEVWFDDGLTLEAFLAETERHDLKGGAPAHSPEAKIALRQGKRPAKAKLGVLKEGREWSLTLKAESLDLSGIKIPALLSREEEEQFYERMYLLEELEDIILGLYNEFLTIRLSLQWDAILVPCLKTWITSDTQRTQEDYPTQALFDALNIKPHPVLSQREA